MATFFPRPEEEFVVVVRRRVDGRQCPDCDGTDVRSYPVLNARGWYETTKCQQCLCVLDEVAMPIWGFWKPLTADWERSEVG